MFEIYVGNCNGTERNVSEEIGYYSDANAAKITADTFEKGANIREVDEVFIASQNYLHRMRG